MNLFKKSVAVILVATFTAGCIPPGLEKPGTSTGSASARKPGVWDKDYDPYADIKAEKKAREARKSEFYTSNKLSALPPTAEQSKVLSNWEAVKAKYAKVKNLNTKQSIELGAAVAPLLLAADKEWLSLNPSNKEVEIVGRLASREVDVDPAILPLYQSLVKYRALHPQDESAVGVQENDLNKRIKELVLAIRMGPYDEKKLQPLATNSVYGKILNDAHPNGYKVLHDYLSNSYTAGTPEYTRARKMKPASGYDALTVEGDIIKDFGLSYCDEKLNSKARNHFSDGDIMMTAAKDAARYMADKTIAGTSSSSASAEMASLLLKGRLVSPVAQGLIAAVPGVGVAIAAYELSTGKNAFTGQVLSPAEKVLSLASMVPGVGALGRNAGSLLKSGLLQKAFASAQGSGKYLDVADVVFSDAADKIAGDYSPKKYADSKIEALFDKESKSAVSAMF
jgi:hypothetical protein